jgi:hypothetical protein
MFGKYKVLRDDIIPTFYVNNRKLRDPDLIVHRGNGDYDLEVANCKFPHYGGLVEMNLLRNVNVRSSVDRIQVCLFPRSSELIPFPVPNSSNCELISLLQMTIDGRFTVKMSARDETGATIHKEQHLVWRIPSMIMIDEGTGEMAAIMRGGASRGTKCFVLDIQAQYGKQFELLVLCSAMAMYESQEREYSSPSGSSHRRRRARHAHASGSSGIFGGSAGTAGHSGM